MSLRSLFLLFAKLGATSFGGYMVLVAQIQAEVVERRGLMTSEEFLKGLALCQLLPGPLSVNMAAFVGYRLAGPAGGAVALSAVLLPATVLTFILAVLYYRFHHLPMTEGFFWGIGPVVAVLIVIAGWRLGSKMIKGAVPLTMAVLTFGYVAFFEGSILVPLLVSGLVGAVLERKGRP